MKESQFQFKNPVVLELVFTYNESFNHEEDFFLENEFTQSISRHETEPKAYVELELEVKSESNTPFYLKIKQASEFVWESDIFSKDEIDQLLSINAPTILLSYMRPIVSTITASSPLPAFNLPFIDFTSNE
ncbi:protein-export chaperone SecB [Erysipelothrix sp. strain 2 (EsS2-6-Brazil)]|uniref:protein-export chaperone SecB n=2 Tax=Erysipelothrix TaxID=1647 RepID=UPI00190D0E31|nr:protein-export chaperone SecB [Erysipelothrix sp. strain 2 (EsS2-6-Brazil)]MBK2401733.1 hypothetical protein [Erysipelothrix sp. strain 2 (EsS2-6-Brazil)]MDE8123731.1 protein-export chaperone SecB [Erysipelothrix rhusiopathiae]MDE8240215.1 protein-export chaperone SecB [Erysipelothrix rhusiopathiae]MDE9420570.1 protein-export chaperone SecB [Erysipelothrix rhusiopathiae]